MTNGYGHHALEDQAEIEQNALDAFEQGKKETAAGEEKTIPDSGEGREIEK